MGTEDEHGFFKVTGRIKEMIIRGGENIYPREIEEYLRKNLKVMDVYVVGIPDKKYGEQVLAAVMLKPGEKATDNEFISFYQGKIARHKIPRYWELVESVPMTASGKVQKYKMMEQYAQKYGI